VGHLDTFAKKAYTPDVEVTKRKTPWKAVGEDLGLSFASSNPRKMIKRAERPLGNLPLEILTYLSAYVEEVNSNGTLKSPVIYGQISKYPSPVRKLIPLKCESDADMRFVVTCLAALTDTMAGAERVLTTPLPVGYNILISQIVLLYVYLLPFQLYPSLGWITIPGTVAAAYIIIGLAAIGNELENPFGNDVNDLPLDHYCTELAREFDVLTAVPAPRFGEFLKTEGTGRDNKVLWPLSSSGHAEWRNRTESDIRSALRAKVVVGNPSPSLSSKEPTKLEA
jgi:putative membrane protein